MGSGLDNFEARYFGSNLGRFMSLDDTDPEDHLGNPQGLNLYSYVQNNPANATDPDGHDCAYVSEGVAYVIRGDCSKVPGSALAITYVPGKIDEDSGSYDPRNGTLSFNYTPYEGGPGKGLAVIGSIFPGNDNSNSGNLTPFAQGVFTDINRRNIMNNTLKMFGAGAVIGVTGGTACYYLCPAATVTTLGRCRPHRNDAETIRKSDEATGRGFVIAS